MKTVPDFDTVIVGAGFSGIGAAIKLDKAGLGDYLVDRGRRRVGRHLALEHLSRYRRRHPVVLLPVLLRAEPDWSRTYAPGQRAEGLRRALRRQVRPAPQDPVQHQGARRRRSTTTPTCGASTPTPAARSPRGSSINASGVLTTPKLPDIDGVDSFAGVTMHTARWDHEPGPDRQARRDHRHRRLGGAGDPRDRADRRAAHRLSAHADLVLPQARRAAARRRRAGRCAFPAARPCSGCSARPTSS